MRKTILMMRPPIMSAPRDDAFAAHAQDDYATELRITRSLAEGGEAWAQSFLGGSHTNGEGVPKNDAGGGVVSVS